MSNITLSKTTLAILKVASQINNSFLAKPGDRINVNRDSGSIMLRAKIDETWPTEFALYELNRFLQVVNSPAMANAELKFEEAERRVNISSGKSNVRYNFSDASLVSGYSDKEIVISNVNASFELSEQTLDDISRMAGILGHTHLTIKVEGGKIWVLTSNPKLENASNEYKIEIAENTENFPDGSWALKLENLILLDGSYQVSIFKGVAAAFEHKVHDVKIFIGLERAAV